MSIWPRQPAPPPAACPTPERGVEVAVLSDARQLEGGLAGQRVPPVDQGADLAAQGQDVRRPHVHVQQGALVVPAPQARRQLVGLRQRPRSPGPPAQGVRPTDQPLGQVLGGFHDERLFRNPSDPNDVLIMTTVADIDRARTYGQSDEVRERSAPRACWS
jgi:hypothetical protein